MTTRTIPLSRRRALAGATGVGVALPVLAACGDDGATAEPTPGASTSSSVPTSDVPSSSSTAAPSESASAAAPEGVVATADVPVGRVILADEQVVVTQPTEGELKVFSSICTHQGCPVTGISDVISCTCHGSTFDLATGDVLGGPAPSPLPAVDFSVEGDQVVLA